MSNIKPPTPDTPYWREANRYGAPFAPYSEAEWRTLQIGAEVGADPTEVIEGILRSRS